MAWIFITLPSNMPRRWWISFSVQFHPGTALLVLALSTQNFGGAVPNPSFQNNCVNASVRNLYFSQNRQNPSYKSPTFSTFHGKIHFYFLNVFICAKDTWFQRSAVPGDVPLVSWKLFSSFTGPSHPNVWSPTTFTAMSTTTKALSLWKLFPYAR